DARAAGDRWPRMEPAEGRGARVFVAGEMRFTAREAFYDGRRRLEAMEASGVDAEAVSPFPPLLDYALSPEDGRECSRHVNEFIATLCQSAPDRFYGLGTVPLQDPALAASELAAVRGAGLAGVEIGSNIGGSSLGDARFREFFHEAERLGLSVFVHALGPTFADRLPGHAMASVGVMTEIALSAASLIMGGTAERCPNLRLAFSHGAGGFPLMLPRAHYFWAGTWNEEPPSDGNARGAAQLPRSPYTYARRFYYDTLVFDRRALQYLVDLIGAGHLLIGSDFPAMDREQPVGKTLRELGLPGHIVDDVTWHNALRFLGVEAPPISEVTQP
ncbi:MAG: amidohydrolase family protein, partial [Candidatus Dormibacteraeota bacterium]|nr:amidohydrolase family protein [Candidatus Dormibacteraeota bacterium]